MPIVHTNSIRSYEVYRRGGCEDIKVYNESICFYAYKEVFYECGGTKNIRHVCEVLENAYTIHKLGGKTEVDIERYIKEEGREAYFVDVDEYEKLTNLGVDKKQKKELIDACGSKQVIIQSRFNWDFEKGEEFATGRMMVSAFRRMAVAVLPVKYKQVIEDIDRR